MKLRKGAKHAPSSRPKLQYAALPWRDRNGAEILLVSSRGTQRWIIPKGWPMKGRSPSAAAAREALEEAGVSGKIGKQKVGEFHYLKRLGMGDSLPCKVTVFPLVVTHQRKTWPECKQRVTRWFPPEEAAQLVQEPELRQLISEFGKSLVERADVRLEEGRKPKGANRELNV